MSMRTLTLRSLAAALALCLASAAAADSHLGGMDWMWGKNTEQGAVLIGKRVYHLAAHTQISGYEQERLSLPDLVWVPELESLAKKPRVPNLWVEFDATEVGDRLVLNWVKLSRQQEGMGASGPPNR